MWFASHEAVDLRMCCLRRRTLKLINVWFLSPPTPASGALWKRITRCHSQWPCDYEYYEWPKDNPQLSQLLSQLCDSTMSSRLFHCSNWFLHCVNYVVLFLHQQQILTYYKILIYNFSPTSLSDLKFLQKDLLCLFMCYTIFFFIQIRGAGHW